jgi:hypothetical protein
MIFQGREEHYLLGLSLDEMKIVYRSMWNDLKARQLFGSDEEATDLLFELQTLLQREATRLGINVGDHSQWAAWVGLDESCQVKPRRA